MDKLFKEGELDVNIQVVGETDTYLVKIRMENFLDAVQGELYKNNEKLDLRTVTKALVGMFNTEDVYVSCECPDFHYRIAYYDTENDITSGQPEIRPSDVTNPNDTKGPGCKHIMLVLSNNSWLIKVASVINNYIKYMKEHRENLYAKFIYPALYGKPWEPVEYEEPTQVHMGDEKEELPTDSDTIDTSNKKATERGRFEPGNEFRFQKGDNGDADQIELDLDEK